MSKNIGSDHGKRLLRLAKETIAQRLGLLESVDQSGLADEELNQELATFVTLKIDGQLRGCIGNLEATGPLLDSLITNARQAAFHDHRFSPLTVTEFDRISVDISILTEPVQLQYENGDDRLKKLRPGIDGVILKKGRGRATFLPQVWKQLSQPQLFIEHLCLKAGLSRNSWEDPGLEIFLYQVQSFDEEDHAVES